MKICKQNCFINQSVNILWSDLENSESKVWQYAKQILLVLGGALVLAISAQLSIPFQPVPLTFQGATVVLIGLVYGSRYAASVVATYLLCGAIGFPVFANFAAGWQVFLGPTAGYLIGFLPAAIVSGYLAERGAAKNIFSSFLAGLVGTIVLFGCGVFILAKFFSLKYALIYGVYPFVITDIIKVFAVACLVPKFWKNNKL